MNTSYQTTDTKTESQAEIESQIEALEKLARQTKSWSTPNPTTIFRDILNNKLCKAYILGVVALNKCATSEILQEILNHKLCNIHTWNDILENTNVTNEILADILNKINNELDPQREGRFYITSLRAGLVTIAKNQHVSAEILQNLLVSTLCDEYVLSAIAKNENITATIFQKILDHEKLSYNVLCYMASNQKLTSEMCKKIFAYTLTLISQGDYYSGIWMHLIDNKKTSSEIIFQIIEHDLCNAAMLRAIMQNRRVTTEIIQKIFASKFTLLDRELLVMIAGDQNTPSEILARISQHSLCNDHILQNILSNVNAAPELIRGILSREKLAPGVYSSALWNKNPQVIDEIFPEILEQSRCNADILEMMAMNISITNERLLHSILDKVDELLVTAVGAEARQQLSSVLFSMVNCGHNIPSTIAQRIIEHSLCYELILEAMLDYEINDFIAQSILDHKLINPKIVFQMIKNASTERLNIILQQITSKWLPLHHDIWMISGNYLLDSIYNHENVTQKIKNDIELLKKADKINRTEVADMDYNDQARLQQNTEQESIEVFKNKKCQ